MAIRGLVKIHLLIIDGQRDFMDMPGSALPVTGAVEDAKRTAALIDRLDGKIDDMSFTFDSHHKLHVAHPILWMDSDGNPPPPFTVISLADIKSGRWKARNPRWQDWQGEYVETLESKGRYPLVIWPPHCLIGSDGYALEPHLQKAMFAWEERNFAMANKVTKGSNYKTEHYSAVQAEVVDPDDPTTSISWALRKDGGLISAISDADIVLLAGQALSHCVANTVRDIATEFGASNVEKLHLLTDCTSPVAGFEKQGQDFVSEMQRAGMKLVKSDEFLLAA